MTGTKGALLRAGFWRRVGAFAIDLVVILLPLQILVAVLFAQTNGYVQGNFFGTTVCRPASDVPEGLHPSPPAGANFVTQCDSRLFGFPTARSLTVGIVAQKDNIRISRSISYALDADGKPINEFNMRFVGVLALLLYLAAMEWRSGATVGKSALKVRVIDSRMPDKRGITPGKAVVRNLAMWIGAVPSMLLFAKVLFFSPDPLATMSSGGFWFLSIVALFLELAWVIGIVVSVSRKRDPLYDRIAGTSVVKPK